MTKDELRKALDFVCEERDRLQRENERLQDRKDKAIEYIKSNYPVCAGKDLLNILEGKEC